MLGPTRSGKTTSIIIPNVLSAPGSVVLTSTKRDVVDSTARARGEVGDTLLFDPMGSSGPHATARSIGWTPLTSARRWDGALDTAGAMVAASQRRSSARTADHWAERSAALLSTLIHAGSIARCPMAEVVRWVDRREGRGAHEVLEGELGRDHPATGLLEGIMATESREQSSIWSTTSGVLGAYRSLGALETTERDGIDPHRFVESSDTLYICATGRSQELTAPLVVGLLNEIRAAAYERSSIERPVLFALDELANIAPLPDLPQLVSEGGGQGVLTIGCLQDLSQARSRWGTEADGFLSLFSSTLLLGGVADRSTLRAFSDLAGTELVARRSVTRQGAGRRRARSATDSVSREPALPFDAVAQGRPGEALLLDASKAVGRVTLTVAHRDEPWRSRIALDRKLRLRDR